MGKNERYKIQEVEYAEGIWQILQALAFSLMLLCGLLGLKLLEQIQILINRAFGTLTPPQDKDLHLFFFLCLLYFWLPIVSLSRLFMWLRLVISDGEPAAVWPHYRRLIETNGVDRFLRDSDATLVDASEYGQLYRKQLQFGSEPIMLVAVTDATVGPSGKASRYFLRVPPYMRTAKEAVAWTFGMSPRSYTPNVQT